MNTFHSKFRRLAVAATALPMLFAVATTQAAEQQTPSGQVYFSGAQFGLILQIGSGGGQLVYKGGNYPFDMSGLKIGANIGPAKTTAVGEVYNLNKLSDFEGTYSGTSASITPIIGGGGIWLENEKGVKMYIKTEKVGLEMTLSAGGATLTFWDSVKQVMAKDPSL
jgi:hypothetical protein